MRTVIVRNGTRISLGKQGENKAVRVVWPEIAEKYTKLYGDGRFELMVVQKGQAYPAVVSVDGADLVWDVLAADVATVGAGSLELIYYVGDTIAKSQTWETFVVASKSAEGTTTPPDPAKNWVDTVLKSSSDAKQAATESAESAKQAAASREAIENMEAAAVSLSPNSKATVEKSLVDGKVKLTFGIPKGENGIFWLNTAAENKIVETLDEIVAAWKAGKSILVRDTVSFPDFVAIAPAFLIRPVKSGNDIIAMVIVCGGSARGSSEIGAIDAVLNVTYYITSTFENATFELKQSINADIALEIMPNESQLNGSPGVSNSASPVDHVHPAPFPDWTNNIGKALFVENNNETPSQAFEWRDVPNGDFTSKVGDFLRVAEVDTQGKPTAWETVDAAGGETWEKIAEIVIPEGADESTVLTINKDSDGNPFSLVKARLCAKFPKYTGATTIPNFSFVMLNGKTMGRVTPLAYTSAWPKLSTSNITGMVYEIDVSGAQQIERVRKSGNLTWSDDLSREYVVYGTAYDADATWFGDTLWAKPITSIGGTGMLIYPGCRFVLYGVRA